MAATKPLEPHMHVSELPFAVWIYDDEFGGEPAFELKFSEGGDNDIALEVTPMHMDGEEAKTTRIVAR